MKRRSFLAVLIACAVCLIFALSGCNNTPPTPTRGDGTDNKGDLARIEFVIGD